MLFRKERVIFDAAAWVIIGLAAVAATWKSNYNYNNKNQADETNILALQLLELEAACESSIVNLRLLLYRA